MKQLGCDVVGVAFDGEAAVTAHEFGLDVGLWSLYERGFARATFDAVMMGHVIEHLPGPKTTLRECLSTLKPGGQLPMLTSNADPGGQRHFGREWVASTRRITSTSSRRQA
ncbi:class I SAM-dependent methyltransferase [Mesorhizobium sp. AR07]|uniref:class I SAM-dependent methyltransferase n=1 Tax=Mesorhizobium sp. AR07 TaxID=2865838 RepID=UPI0039B6FF20